MRTSECAILSMASGLRHSSYCLYIHTLSPSSSTPHTAFHDKISPCIFPGTASPHLGTPPGTGFLESRFVRLAVLAKTEISAICACALALMGTRRFRTHGLRVVYSRVRAVYVRLITCSTTLRSTSPMYSNRNEVTQEQTQSGLRCCSGRPETASEC